MLPGKNALRVKAMEKSPSSQRKRNHFFQQSGKQPCERDPKAIGSLDQRKPVLPVPACGVPALLLRVVGAGVPWISGKNWFCF